MEIASLIKKLLLIGVVGIGLLLFCFWWAFYRTQSTDISKNVPYSDIIGEELIAKHESFIALNYKHFVNENPYVLQLHDDFYEEAGDSYKLPLGTVFKIESAKSFHNVVSGFSTNYVLGSVFIEELGEEVKFEIPWGGSGTYALSDKEPFNLYELVPWLSEALPYKYYSDGRTEPHVWPPRITDNAFRIASNHRFVLKETFQKRRSFDTSYDKEEDWAPNKNYFGVHNRFEEKEISILKLDKVYPDYKSNSDKYAFHPDYRMELSRNFITIVLAVFKGEHELESRLINYDLDGNVIDHINISYDEIAEGMTKRESFLEGNLISVKDIVSFNSEEIMTSTFKILENGKIEQVNDN